MTNRRMEHLSAETTTLQLSESPIPATPRDGYVVKVHYAGVCHTDLHLVLNQLHPVYPFPRVYGHEISGEVYTRGENVTDSEFQIGDKVAVYPWTSNCQTCETCKAGLCHICKEGGALGISTDGGYQEYVVVENRHLPMKLPPKIAMDVASLVMCSGITAFHGICQVTPNIELQTKIRGSSSLLICGAGGLGLWGISIAKATLPSSTKVYVADISEEKLALAKKYGADETILWNTTDSKEILVAATTAKTDGGVDAACDFVGLARTSDISMLSLLKGGIIAIIGLGGGVLPLNVNAVPLQAWTIVGTNVGEKHDVIKLFELIAAGKVTPPPITHFRLEEANDALKRLEEGKISGRGILKIVQ